MSGAVLIVAVITLRSCSYMVLELVMQGWVQGCTLLDISAAAV